MPDNLLLPIANAEDRTCGGCETPAIEDATAGQAIPRCAVAPLATELPPEVLDACSPRRRGISLEGERVRIYRPSYAPGVEVWSVQRSARLWTVLLEAFCFNGQDAGSANWHKTQVVAKYRRRDLELKEQRMGFFEPGEPFRQIRASSAASFHAINVSPALAAEYAPAAPRHLELASTDDPELFRLFTTAWRSVEALQLDVTEREHHLRAFLAHAFSLGADASGREETTRVKGCARSVQRAREFIHANHAENVSLKQVAEAAGRSVWYLERSFVASVGIPIHRYLQHVRLSRAMALLQTGARASAAAAAAGFADQSHMTRSFRSAFGFTPRQFQRATGAAEREGPG